MIYFKRNYFFLGLGLLVAFLTGCAPKPVAVQKTVVGQAAGQDQNSLLWEISGKGLKTPSYLYGTIHLIPKEDFFLTDATKKAFAASPRAAFEINMKDMTDPSALFTLIGKATMGGGEKLEDLLSEADYQVVEKKFDEMGLPLKMLERLKPMFLSALLEGGGGQEDSTGKKEVSTSYEMEFLKMGEDQKKVFGGLETVEFQLSIFDSIPYKKQADMLVKGLKSKDTGAGDDMKQMISLYKKQDVNELSRIIESGDSEITGYENMFIGDRNKKWIPVMARMMVEMPTFFAVGAGHLGGEKGVISLLRKEGYSVRPLR